MWIYDQRTGTLSRNDEVLGQGYSGFGDGKNNPVMQDEANLGPIPKGSYEIGPPRDTPTHGPHVMELSPSAETHTFGRSGFLIHGDSVVNPGTASHGCIILARDLRDKISSSNDSQLRVV
jgi:Protein of unknown function (DUF2778)